MKVEPSDQQRPIVDRDELLQPFREAEKPASLFRIGAETEKFGVDEASGRPLGYEGEAGVLALFGELCEKYGWQPVREFVEGPIVALKRQNASITLEPGAQFELSGSPLGDVHRVVEEQRQHLLELGQLECAKRLAWLGVGFQPFAKLDALPWVPKQRYRVMRRYLPTRGAGGLDMMQRTATAQLNFDYSSESDAMAKLKLLLKLAPVVQAFFANAPFKEGEMVPFASIRGDVWLHMDPARSGLVRSVWGETSRYTDYIEWALDAGMFLFKRGNAIMENTGQTFRDFLEHGYAGHRATMEDWRLHLMTLFPEVRLKNTLEVRSCDSLPAELVAALAAFYTGLIYDQRSLEAAEALVSAVEFGALELARPAMVRTGPRAPLLGRPVFEWMAELVDLAALGLKRRARLDADGRDESVYLQPVFQLLERRKCPADVLIEDLSTEPGRRFQQVIGRTRLNPEA